MEEKVVIERLKIIANNTQDPSTEREILELINHIETGAFLPPLTQKKRISPKPYIFKFVRFI